MTTPKKTSSSAPEPSSPLEAYLRRIAKDAAGRPLSESIADRGDGEASGSA